MTPEKISSVVEMYKVILTKKGVRAKRIDIHRTFGSCSVDELLAHALYLCEGVLDFTSNPDKFGKMNRHLTAIQMCLSFANVYTLDNLMSHNRPT